LKCIVFGGGGFIGSNLCAGLLQAGHEVRVFEYPHVPGQCPEHLLKHLEWIEGDITNPDDVDLAMAGCNVAFHLVSTCLPKSSNQNPVYDIESNLVATVRLLESAHRHKVGKVVFASSGGTVYGIPHIPLIGESHPTEPICSYGIVKLAIEKYLHLFYTLHGLDYVALRIANPYGIGQRVAASQGAVAVFLHRALNREPIEIWGDGSVVRDYIHISDVVSSFVACIEYQGPEKVFNIGAGIGRSLNDLVRVIGQVLEQPVNCNYNPSRQFDVPINVLDIQRAIDHLGWAPRMEFEEGIRDTLVWMRTLRLVPH
jgi:UDP-glucose 4-epimerase